jgi:hypothetical protein
VCQICAEAWGGAFVATVVELEQVALERLRVRASLAALHAFEITACSISERENRRTLGDRAARALFPIDPNDRLAP